MSLCFVRRTIARPMRKLLTQERKVRLQRIFWMYLTNNFALSSMQDFKNVEPSLKCTFIPITLDNVHRVGDFREEGRISQYRDKLANKEKGFFAEHNGKMVGSLWATINDTKLPVVARRYMKLGPNEALIHDVVTSEKSRGMRIGPYMMSQMITTLFKEYGVSRIVTEVHFRNRASMRMMDRVGLRMEHKVISVCALGKLVLQISL